MGRLGDLSSRRDSSSTRTRSVALTAERALAEAVAFLQGMGDAIDPDQGARIVAEQLAVRGFSVQPVSAPVLYDVTPETLRRVRQALGVTLTKLKDEAGISFGSVMGAEDPRVRTQRATLEKIAGALIRLGARRSG